MSADRPTPRTGSAGRRWRPSIPSGPALLLMAIGVGLLLAALDAFPGAAFWAERPMTSQAVGGAILFIQGALLLTGFLRWRELDRLNKITVVAYGSLAQAANDAGRRLLAPLNGADLFELGIPADDPGRGQDVTMAELDRGRLARHGFDVSFREPSGTWASHDAVIAERLPVLLADPDFVRRLYRSVTRARRDTMAAAAQWAATMLVDERPSRDLVRFRQMSSTLEPLGERLRQSGLISQQPATWSPSEAWIERVMVAFRTVIDAYEQIRDEFARQARLESDVFSGREAVARPR